MRIDLALLILRLTTGSFLAGHGSQKLFGWFGGHGIRGTAGWLESLGFRPGIPWALAVGLSEFCGGLLTALGLFNPIGPLAITSVMVVAIRKVHWGKPIWVSEGGAELPATNIAVASAIALAGPGRFSLDRLLGVRLSAVPALVGMIIGFVLALTNRRTRSLVEMVLATPATQR